MQGERVLQTALLDAGDHRLHSLDRALHTTRLPSDDAVPALSVAVGLSVLDVLVPSLELLLNAPGARANHAVPAVVRLKAKVRAARSFYPRISDES